MQVTILDKRFQLENEPGAPKRLFSLIEQSLQGTNYHFSHLVIDGIAVYDQFEETIMQSIDQIKEIDVQVKTIEQFIRETFGSTKEYLDRAMPEIERLNDQFYQGPDQKTWSLFLDLLEGLQWIHQLVGTVKDVDFPQLNRDVFRALESDLLKHYTALEEGLQNQDHVLIADVIQYELIPLLETLRDEIDSVLTLEEKHHDSN